MKTTVKPQTKQTVESTRKQAAKPTSSESNAVRQPTGEETPKNQDVSSPQ